MHIPTLAALALAGTSVYASTLNRRAEAEALIEKATEFLQMRLNGYEDYYTKNPPQGDFPACAGNSSVASRAENDAKCGMLVEAWTEEDDKRLNDTNKAVEESRLGHTHSLVIQVCGGRLREGFWEVQEKYIKCLCEDEKDQQYFLPAWKHAHDYYLKECPGLLKELEELETKTYTETYVSYLFGPVDSTTLFLEPTATQTITHTVTPAAAQATGDAEEDDVEEEDKKDDEKKDEEKKDDEKKDDDKDSGTGVKTWSVLAAGLGLLGAVFSSL